MDYTQIIWLVAAFCTTFAWVPQVYRIIQTKKTKDISWLTYIMIAFWLACWLVYWIMLGDIPLILANSISLLFALTILIFKKIYW